MIELIHNHEQTLSHWRQFFEAIDIPFRENDLRTFKFSLEQPPDDIHYLNQVYPKFESAADRQSMLLWEQYLDYLAAYNRHVLNDQRILPYELSYLEKLRVFKRYGLNYPATVFSTNAADLYNKASAIPTPVHLIPERGLIEYGRDIFHEMSQFKNQIDQLFQSDEDLILFVQQYIEPVDDINHKLLLTNDTSLIGIQNIGNPDIVVENNNSTSLVKKLQELRSTVGYEMLEVTYVKAKNNAIYVTDINGTISPGWPQKSIEQLFKKKFLSTT